jgi:hypothetical protein
MSELKPDQVNTHEYSFRSPVLLLDRGLGQTEERK